MVQYKKTSWSSMTDFTRIRGISRPSISDVVMINALNNENLEILNPLDKSDIGVLILDNLYSYETETKTGWKLQRIVWWMNYRFIFWHTYKYKGIHVNSKKIIKDHDGKLKNQIVQKHRAMLNLQINKIDIWCQNLWMRKTKIITVSVNDFNQ